jgi:co-chaperonin GroES (HSP10)
MKKEKIRLFRDFLLCRPIPPEDKAFGGIIIPADEGLVMRYFKVLEVGQDVLEIKSGDTIVTMGRNPGAEELKFNGEKLVIMRERYVGGVME